MRRTVVVGCLLGCGSGHVAAVAPPPSPSAPPPVIATAVPLPPLDVIHPAPTTPIPQLVVTAPIAVVQRDAEDKEIGLDPSGKLLAQMSIGQLQILDVATGDVRAQFAPIDLLTRGTALFSPDSSRVAVLAANMRSKTHVMFANLATAALEGGMTCDFNADFSPAAWTPRGDAFLMWCRDQVLVWDVATARERYETPRRPDLVRAWSMLFDKPIPLSPDGTRFLVPSDDKSVEVRRVADGQVLTTARAIDVVARAWWQDDRSIALSVASEHGYTTEVHDATAGMLLDRSAPTDVDPDVAFQKRDLERENRATRRRDGTPAFDPYARKLAFGSGSTVATTGHGFLVYDLATEQVQTHVAPGWTFEVALDDDWLWTWPAPEQTVKYARKTGARTARSLGHGEWSSDDLRHVELSKASPSELVLSDATGRRLAAWTQPKQDWPDDHNLAWSADNRFVYAPGSRETKGHNHPMLYVWRSSDLALVHAVALSPVDVERWSELVPLPGGAAVVSTGTRTAIDLATGKVQQLAPKPDAPESTWVQLAPGDKQFALAGRVFDTHTLKLVEDLGVAAVMGWPFSPTGDRIVVKGPNGFAIHTLGSGRPATLLAAPPYDTTGLYGAAWSPDGTTIVTSGDSVVLWDVASGTPTLEIREPNVSRFAFVGPRCLLDTIDRPHETHITNIATHARLELYGTATPDPKTPDAPADPTGLLVIASDGRYAGDAAGLALVRVRSTTDVRSAMTAPTVAPDAAKAAALVEDFVAACK